MRRTGRIKRNASCFWGLAVLAAVAVLAGGCRQKENTYAPPPPPEVTVARPTQQDVTGYAEFTGTTDAFQFAEIRARVEGYLEKINFVPSTYVKKDALLFVIDPRPYQAKVNEAAAELEVRYAQLHLSEATLKRKEAAYKDRAISEVEVIEARAQQEKAQAQVEAGKAALETARLNLSYTQVQAPFDGRVDRNLVDVGNLVGATLRTLLTTIVDDDPIYVYFNVDEPAFIKYQEMRQKMGKGAQDPEEPPVIFMALGSEKEFRYQGKGDFIENRLDPSTGTIQSRAVFPNPDHVLVPGLFVRVRIPLGEPRPALLVPEVALGSDQQGRYLLVLNGQNEVERRSVEIGQQVGDLRVIAKGIEANDNVIVNGIQRARPGAKVTPKTASEQQPVPAAGAPTPAQRG